MDKKNVLHLVEYLYLGGIERLLEQLAISTGNGANLHFYTYETQTLAGIGKAIEDKGYPVFTYKKKSGRDWRLVADLIRVVKEQKIDIIHTHDFGPVEYAVLLKLRCPNIRLIHTQHTMHHFIAKAHYRYFFQFASYFYDQIIGVSEFVRDSILESCPLTNRRALTVIPNGVDTDKFRPSRLDGPPSDTLRLVCVARISHEKNLGYLLNTCRLLKEAGVPFILHHAGTSKIPESREKIEQYIQEHKLEKHIVLHGFIDNAAEVLALGDYFVSSSLREGHPVALLEAMASEKFCICSDIAPHRETSHGVLDLFDVQDEKALFMKLKAIYLTKPDLENQKRKARDLIIKQYSLEKMVGSYVELYQ